MIDIFSQINKWVEANKPFAIARVIKTWGSSPRPIGSALVVSETGEMLGSVSGGCVEGAVSKAVMKVLEVGAPVNLHFGVTDEEAWEVGLSCGGKIDVYVTPSMAFSASTEEQAIWKAIQSSIEDNTGGVLLNDLEQQQARNLFIKPDGKKYGSLLGNDLELIAKRAFQERKNQIIEHNGKRYFAHVFPPKSRLLIIGAAHITVDLVNFANQFGFETIVIDPRGFFASNTQFDSPPSQLIKNWPQEVLNEMQMDAYTYAVVLSHDSKIDDPALHYLLKSEVAYIGALGSNRTHAKRVKRLEAAGFETAEIEKIHAPIGVNINAKSPKEIALSIISEIIQIKNKYSRKH